ncbi:MAG: HAD-IA family hydrolase [Clostridiaceae bacterium]|jgi:pyrophosphatase PpaX|nr:HAD-IA family hydrolase [Oscillospiraceae bacterium]NLO62504.1 HAD-IA family hydrolase [Clostridiaceae bacterium]
MKNEKETLFSRKSLKYDAILYDFDGTLVDTIPLILKCFHIAFEEVLGIRKDDKDILATIGLPLWTAFREYDEETQRKLHDAYIRANDLYLPTDVRIFPGIHEGLSAVADLGVVQGVVTSKRRDPALFTMRQFDLEKYFSVLVTREDTTEHKPAPAPIFFAAGKLGIADPKRILFVGDSIHDLICSRNAGTDSAAVGWTYMPKDELASLSPTYWLENLSALSCILTEREL